MEALKIEGDDDLFVVIVEGDEEVNQKVITGGKQNVKSKSEVPGLMKIEDLIETATEHGKLIPFADIKIEPEIKQEPEEAEFEEFEFANEEGDADNDYVPEEGDADNDYVPEEEECSEVEEDTLDKKKPPSECHRYRMRKPDEMVSFVKELKEQYPELKDSKDLLVEALCEVMLAVKVPDPPPDYFLMNGIMFECATCGAMRDSMPAMGRHWQEKHGPRYLVCYACGVDFRSTTNLYKHEKRCAAPDALWVLKARARCIGRKARSRPFIPPPDQMPPPGKSKPRLRYRFQCSLCPAVYANKQSLKAHELAHRGHRPFRCDQCHVAYTSHTGLHRHKRLKHSDELYICDSCARPFHSKSSLIVHLNVHKPERPYPCSFCGRRYAQQMARRLHEDRAHRHLPPPCACRVCPKRYPRMSLLKDHMLREHGMNLITRKMFYKSLPYLSEEQLKQAMVVMKSNTSATNPNNYETLSLEQTIDDMIARSKHDKIQELNTTAQTNYDGPKVQTEIIETQEVYDQQESLQNEIVDDENDEFIKCVRKLQQGDLNDKTQMIVIQDGQVIAVDESNMHLYEELMKEGAAENVVNIVSEENAEVITMTDSEPVENVKPKVKFNVKPAVAPRKSDRTRTLSNKLR